MDRRVVLVIHLKLPCRIIVKQPLNLCLLVASGINSWRAEQGFALPASSGMGECKEENAVLQIHAE